MHRKENQSTSVNLSEAGDQIEKWIARRVLGANLHCDQGAIRLSTCLEHDNGHRWSLAKWAANKDEITILARKPTDNKQVCGGLQPGSWSCFDEERTTEKSDYFSSFTGTTFTHKNWKSSCDDFLISACILTNAWHHTMCPRMFDVCHILLYQFCCLKLFIDLL